MKKLSIALVALLFVSCTTPHLAVVESSVVGLSVSPGNQTSNPQITFAYKRSEFTLVPTAMKPATSNNDCFSTLTAMGTSSRFFGGTSINDVLATGFASRNLAENPGFTNAITNTNR